MDVSVEVLTRPVPEARIDVSGIPDGAARLEVTRRVAGVTMFAPRATSAVAGTTGLAQDFDVPLGVPVEYRVDAVAADGAVLASAQADAVTGPDVPDSHVWVSDPLDTGSAMLVRALVGTDQARSYPAAVETWATGSGGRSGSVGPRAGLESWPLVLWVEGAEEVRRLRWLLTESSGLLVRAPAAHQLPPLMFGFVPTPTETASPIPGMHAWAQWQVELRITDGPMLKVALARWSWRDLTDFCLAEGITWATLEAVFPTWRDVRLGID